MNRVAVVTGGAGGIGLACALALAAKGCAVAVLDRLLPDPGDIVAQLRAAGSPAAVAVRFDLADLPTHAAALDEVEASLGPIAILVDNAGVPARVRGDLLAVDPVAFDMVLDVNLRGTFFLTQEVARRMVAEAKAPPGRAIVVVSSVSATMASPERGEYCLSKAALPMLVKLFALRLAKAGIGVFEVRPGIVRTPMTEVVAERYDGLIADGLVPLGRWGTGSDIAAMVAMLSSGEAVFATGSVLVVDGGLSIERL